MGYCAPGQGSRAPSMGDDAAAAAGEDVAGSGAGHGGLLKKQTSGVSNLFKTNLLEPNVEAYYTKLGLVGEGTYGAVYKTTQVGDDSGIFYALKCMKTMGRSASQDGLPISTCREIALLRELKHENVIDVKRVFLNHVSREVCFLFEYSEYDLQAITKQHRVRLKKNPKYVPAESMLKSVLHQLLLGIKYLHANWIIHRDLKPANVLVMGQEAKCPGQVKIADLGMARLFNAPLKPLADVDPVVVTSWYRAPELLLGAKHYTKAVDLWAVGCIMAELAMSKPLFAAEENEQTADPYNRQVVSSIFERIGYPISVDEKSTSELEWQYLSQLPKYSQAVKDFPELNKYRRPGNPGQLRRSIRNFSGNKAALLEKLLRLDPKQRASARSALSHTYFSSAPQPKANIFEGLPSREVDYPKRPFVQLKKKVDPGHQSKGRKRAAANQAPDRDDLRERKVSHQAR